MLATRKTEVENKVMLERIAQNNAVARTAALGSFLVVSAFGYGLVPKYGHVVSLHRGERDALPIEEPSIITANAHTELPEKIDNLQEEIELEKPGIVVMQEVGANALFGMNVVFSGWDIMHARADIKVRLGRGGIGNLIMSRAPLENERVHKIDEPGFVEDRLVAAAKTSITIEGRREEIQVMSYHISRHEPYREEEFGRLLKIVDEHRGEADSTIVCGDSNTRPAEIQDRFGTIGFRAVTSPYKTYIGSPQGSIVDSCAYDQKGRVGFRRATIGKKFRTDHRPARYKLVKLTTAKSPTVS